MDDPEAAKRLVSRIFRHVEQLQEHPESGSIPKELRAMKAYRQIVEKPCRVFYRISGETVFIVHVVRGEKMLGRGHLKRRS